MCEEIRSMMKRAQRMTQRKKGNPTKSVSMPVELWARVERRLEADPELDFSVYVRRLIRADLEQGEAA